MPIYSWASFLSMFICTGRPTVFLCSNVQFLSCYTVGPTYFPSSYSRYCLANSFYSIFIVYLQFGYLLAATCNVHCTVGPTFCICLLHVGLLSCLLLYCTVQLGLLSCISSIFLFYKASFLFSFIQTVGHPFSFIQEQLGLLSLLYGNNWACFLF